MRSSRGAKRLSAVALVLSALACSIDDRKLTVGDASPPPAGVVLISDGQGFVDGTNAAGILGYWYLASDATEPASCLDAGFSREQCSMIITPPRDGNAFVVSDPGHVCISGIAAKVLVKPSTMEFAFDQIWGVTLGLDVNNPDRTKVNRAGSYDVTAHGITGFSFVIDSPPTSLKIAFSTAVNPDTAAYWGGSSGLTSPVRTGLNVVRWADVDGPMYLAEPPPFDRTQLRGIQFVVPSNATLPVPFDFCISSLTALTD